MHPKAALLLLRGYELRRARQLDELAAAPAWRIFRPDGSGTHRFIQERWSTCTAASDDYYRPADWSELPDQLADKIILSNPFFNPNP